MKNEISNNNLDLFTIQKLASFILPLKIFIIFGIKINILNYYIF